MKSSPSFVLAYLNYVQFHVQLNYFVHFHYQCMSHVIHHNDNVMYMHHQHMHNQLHHQYQHVILQINVQNLHLHQFFLHSKNHENM